MSYAIFQPASVDPILSIAIRNGIRRPPRKFSQWLIEELVIPDGPFKGERFNFLANRSHAFGPKRSTRDNSTNTSFQGQASLAKV